MLNLQSSEESAPRSKGKLILPTASQSLLFMLKPLPGFLVDESWLLLPMPPLTSAEESTTNPPRWSGCVLKNIGAAAVVFCDVCTSKGKVMGKFWGSRDWLQLKLMSLHEEPSRDGLFTLFCCCFWPCKPCLLVNWFAGAGGATCSEQDELSRANSEACTDWNAENISASVAPGSGGPQVCDSARCAMELVFLKILQIVQESCFWHKRKISFRIGQKFWIQLNCTIWIDSAYIKWNGLVNGSLGERGIVERREPEFMHHPVSFHPSCRSPFVEHKRLLQAYALGTLRGIDWPVCPCGLPEPGCCDSVWSNAVAVFPVPWTVEVPLFLAGARKLCQWTRTIKSEMLTLQTIRYVFYDHPEMQIFKVNVSPTHWQKE